MSAASPRPHPPLLAEVWREQSAWSQAADRMKRGIERARLCALAIVVLVAVCGTASAALGEALHPLGRWLAVLAAVGSVSLPPLRKLWSGVRLQNWTRARSVSEAMKADVYLWLARVRPFTDDVDAAKLRERVDRLRGDAADLVSAAERCTPVARDLPAVHDLPTYFAVRVEGQRTDYYRARVRRIERRLGWFRAVGFVLGAAGAVLGGAAALLATSFAAWIAVVSTIAAAVAVHVSATRYEFQRIEFARTAEELRRIKTLADQPGAAEQDLQRLARRAERVISIENQGWMAKLAEDPADQKTPG